MKSGFQRAGCTVFVRGMKELKKTHQLLDHIRWLGRCDGWLGWCENG